MDVPLGKRSKEGDHLIIHGLFAQGNDFTTPFAERKDYQGNSLLLQLWQGYEGRATDGAKGLKVWELSNEEGPQGVIAWLHTHTAEEPFPVVACGEVPRQSNHLPKQRIPIAPLGHVMCFLKAPFRGQGIMQDALLHHVVPELVNLAHLAREQSVMPVVAANDACHSLLGKLTSLPLVEHFTPCLALRAQVWRYHMDLRMHPEDPPAQSAFIVEPQPIARRKRSVRM